MGDWKKIFAGLENSGVYEIGQISDFAEIADAATAAGLAFFHVDLTGIGTTQAFMKATAQAFGFPEYFGQNWDAFEDCITDLAWSEKAGYVMFFGNLHDFVRQSAQDAGILRSILTDAASYWKREGVSFFALLHVSDRRND